MDNYSPVDFSDVELKDGFWKKKNDLIRDVTIFSVEKRFRETGRFEAFKFSWTPGSELPRPHFFWDSDVAKWIESVAYILQKGDCPGLYASAREVIDDIKKNQDENGYFNIYHTVVEPEIRFKNRDHHELYCLGHLIEAAVAWFNATGEEDFLEAMDKYVDHVIKVFVVDKSAAFVTPGHEEIELALIKLYRLRKDRKYLDLAMFFLNERGRAKEELYRDWSRSKYDQSHVPVREQKTAEGHSVRACYLYSAMADAARETGDEELLSACKAIFDDIYCSKMYITGGIGSTNKGEAFTASFDLPNDTAYAETCAAIALAFFANRMKDIDFDSKYAEVVETVIFNGMLSGLSLDGKSFFYENPLEINLSDRTRHASVNESDRLPITQRLEVFDCSCCPPNVTRFISSIGNCIFSESGDSIVLHQFIPCSSVVSGAKVTVETSYPLEGHIKVTVGGGMGKKLFVRLPGRCDAVGFDRPFDEKANGYAEFEIAEDEFTLNIDLRFIPRFVAANQKVRADAGKVAVVLGPVVYCAEGVDNSEELFDYYVDTNANAMVEFDPFFGANVLTLEAEVRKPRNEKALYFPADETKAEKKELKLIPYFAFANRGESDMRVWLNAK